MATSSAAIRLKRLRQRFGISAPRLAIRTHIAWYWRALAMITALSISLALVAWMFNVGQRIAGFESEQSIKEIQSLRNYVMELDAELTKLRSVVGSGESSLQIERATQKQLFSRAKLLEQENTSLKQDLALFEGLMQSSESSDEAGLRIDNLQIDSGAVPGEYQYRLLVVNNGGRQIKTFRGSLQLLIRVSEFSKDAMITVPSQAELASQSFQYEIKYFHRIEGSFVVPVGATLKSVEVRLLSDGSVRAKHLVTLK